MVSRKERHQHKRRRSIVRKFLAGTLFLMILIGSSFHIAFADQDITALLTNWFDKETTESIDEIDKAISLEQQKQTERLKEELQLAIQSAEQQLHDFTESEKASRIEELQNYTNALLANLEVSDPEAEKQITNQLDQIIQEAKEKMKAIQVEEIAESETETDE